MKLLLVITSFVAGIYGASAQFYMDYNWSETPIHEDVSLDFLGKSTVGIEKKVIVEFDDGSNMDVFVTRHEKLFVLDEKGIRENNKVYIPLSQGSSVVAIKARTVSPDGEIKVLDKNNIKEVKNVEEYGDFKIFAIEGATPKSNIEILYTVKKSFYPFGWETIQEDYPLKKAAFTLVYGDHNGEAKAYGTDTRLAIDSRGDREAKTLVLEDIPAMIQEDFATPNSNKISVAYQCFNSSANVTNRSVWQNVVRNVCSDAYPDKVSKYAAREVKDKMKPEAQKDTYSKALWVDNFIKSEFTVSRTGNSEYYDVDYVLKNKVGTVGGILKAYGHFLTELEVDFEVVLTANRYIHNFDPYFFTPRAIQDFLIYIPEIKKYISPDRIEYRLSEAPFNILGNGAIFVKKDLSFYPNVVNQMDPDFSRIKRITNISFEDEMSNVVLDQYQEYYGHWAVTNRAVLMFSSEAGKEDFVDYLTGSGIEDKNSISYEHQNEDILNEEYNLPFIVNSKISSASMIENAGDSYIFLVGMSIGTQSELYQEEERVNPILSRYPNVYNYTITVDIPEGYKPEGLDDLKIYKELKKDEKILCKFESDYELKEDVIVISIEEFYKEIDMPVSDYNEFREVINAASDFNKKSILFSKI